MSINNNFQNLYKSLNNEFPKEILTIDPIANNADKAQTDSQKNMHEKSWISKGHPLGDHAEEINFDLFASICGDGFLGLQQVKQPTTEASLTFYTQFLKSTIDQEEALPEDKRRLKPNSLANIKKFHAEMTESLAITNKIKEIVTDGKGKTSAEQKALITAYAKELSDKFQAKGSGWFPGGLCVNGTEGTLNGLMLRLDEKSGAHLINTDMSTMLANHTSFNTAQVDPLTGNMNSGLHFQEFVHFPKPDKKRLFDPMFFEKLIELQVSRQWNAANNIETNDLYKMLSTYLKCQPADGLSPKKYPEAYKKPQRSDVATIKGLSTSLYYSLCQAFSNESWNGKEGVKDYKKLKFLWQSQSLTTYFRQAMVSFRPGDEPTALKLRLFKDVLDNLKRSAEKLQKNGDISMDEIEGFLATADHLEFLFEQAENDFRLNPAPIPALQLDFAVTHYSPTIGDRLTLSPPIMKNSIANDDDQANAPVHDDRDAILLNLIQVESKAHQVQLIDSKTTLEDLRKLNAGYAKLWENPDEFYELLNYSGTSDTFKYLLEKMCSKILEFSTPTDGEDYWSTIPQDHVLDTMKEINQLQQYLLSLSGTAESLKGNNSKLMEFSLALFSLHSITDKLARRLPENKLDGFKTFCPELLVAIQQQKFISDKAIHHEKLKELLKYFYPEFTLDQVRTIYDPVEMYQQLRTDSIFGFINMHIQGPPGSQIGITQYSVSDNEKNRDAEAGNRFYQQFINWDNKDFAQKMTNANFDPANSPVWGLGAGLPPPIVNKDAPAEDQIACLISNSIVPEGIKLLQNSAIRTSQYSFAPPKNTNNYITAHTLRDFNITFNIHQGLDRDRIRKGPISVNARIRLSQDSLECSDVMYRLGLPALGTNSRSDIYNDNNYGYASYPRSILFYEQKFRNQNDFIFEKTKFVTASGNALSDDVETNRQIAELCVDPYDVINRMVTFGKSHINLLNKPEIKEIYNNYLFRPMALLSQLEDNPQIASQAHELFYEIINHYKQLADFDTCLTYINIFNRFSNMVKDLTADMPNKPVLPDYRKVLTEEILPHVESDVNQMLVYKNLLDLYNGPDNVDASLADYVKYRMANKKVEKNKQEELDKGFWYYRKPEIKAIGTESSHALLELSNMMEGVLTQPSEQRNRVLNDVLKSFDPDADLTTNWKGTFPKISNKDYTINLLTFTISKKGEGEVTDLPWFVSKSNDYINVFPNGYQFVTKIDDYTYLVHPQEITIECEHPNVRFYKMIDGKRYTFLSNPPHCVHMMKTVFPSPNDIQCWVDEERGLDVLFYDKGKLMAMGTLSKGKKAQYELMSLHKKEKNGEWVTLEAFKNLDFKTSTFIQKYEHNSSYVELTKDLSTNRIIGIKLPRLGLHLNIKENGVKGHFKAHCLEHPGYYISEEQDIPVKTLSPWIVMKNAKGEQLVLISHQENKLHKQWMEYSLVDGELQSHKTLSRIYLAGIRLQEGKVDDVNRMIKQIVSLKRFTDEESQQLQQLYMGLIATQHPYCIAMAARVAIIRMKNNLKYPLSQTEHKKHKTASMSLEEIEGLWMGLNMLSGNMSRYRLSGSEEKFLIDQMRSIINKHVAKIIKENGAIEGLPEKIKWGMFLSSMDNKHNFLKNKKTDAGFLSKNIIPVMPSEANTQIGIESLRSYFDQGEPVVEIDKIVQHSNISPHNFWGFYKIVQEADHDTREKFLKLIDLNEREGVNPEFEILRAVLKKPKSFPSIDSLREKVRKAKEAYEIMQNVIDPKKYNQLWNQYNKLNNAVNDALKKVTGAFSPAGLWAMFKFGAGMLFKTMTNTLLNGYTHSVTNTIKGGISYIQNKTFTFMKPTSYLEIDQSFDGFFKAQIALMNVREEAPNKAHTKFAENHPDPVVNEKIKKENEELAYHVDNLGVKKIYSLKAPNDLQVIKANLQTKIATFNEMLATEKSLLEWQVNQVSGEREQALINKLHKGGFGQNLNWTDLQKLFLDGSDDAFKAKTGLQEEDITKLIDAIGGYLVKATRVQQMKSAVKEIEKIEKQSDPTSKNLLIQNLGEVLSNTRKYDPSLENRTKLWFEYANGYLYREIQLNKMDKILTSKYKEILAEMPTGFGKTKTMMATLNDIVAKTGKLVVNTWPASLEVTNTGDIQEQMGLSFARKIDHLAFNRTVKFTVKSLKQLYSDMKRDIRLKRPINIRSEALRSMELHFIDLLHQYNSGNNCKQENLKKKIELFVKILRQVRGNSWGTIDEADKNLNPMDKLIYTIGQESKLSISEVDVIEELMNVITSDKFADILKIRENKQPMMIVENANLYDNELLPKVAEHFIAYFNIENAHQQEFIDFVTGKQENIPQFLLNHSRKSEIALLKGELTNVLPACCKGFVNENFGLSKLHLKHANTPKEFAISYANSNTPKENSQTPSQFKNPHETLTKTYITYLHQGLQSFQTAKLIEHLKQQMIAQAAEGISFDKTEAHELFKKLFPKCDILLMKISSNDIENLKMHDEIQYNKDAINYYIKNIIVDQILIYNQSLTSTVQNFRSQFTSSLSVTATPPHAATHGPNTHFIPMKGTSGQVSHLLMTKCSDPSKIKIIESEDPENILADTIDILNDDKGMRSVIDIGAHYKGLSNREVAEKMRQNIKKEQDVLGIIYFEESEEKFKVLYVDSGTVCDLEESELDIDKRVTVYDQNRSFGSDIPQPHDARGGILIGQNSKKDDIGQGAGRMRQLHKDQAVIPIIPRLIANKIFKDPANPNMQELLEFLITNQAQKEATNNYHAQLQQMDNEIRRAALDKLLGLPVGERSEKDKELLGKKVDVKNIAKMFSSVKDLLLADEMNDPWMMYAFVPQARNTKDILTEQYNHCVEKVKKLKGFNSSEKKTLISQLQQYPEKWENIPLPEKMIQTKVGLGMECEVLQEVETEVEQEVHAEIQEKFAHRKAWDWKPETNLFKSGWEKPVKMANIFVRTARAVHHSLNVFKNWYLDAFLQPQHFGHAVVIMTTIASPLVLITSLIVAPIFTLLATAGLGAAGGIGYGLLKLTERVFNFGDHNPILKMSDVMGAHLPKKFNKLKPIFSDKFLVSNNYYTQWMKSIEEVEQKPFSQEQKRLYEVLVIQDEVKGKKEITVLAIDQTDSTFLRKKLKADNESGDATDRKRKIAIYDLHSGIMAQGKNAFESNELEDNQEFTSLITQAKIINGEVNYTAKELEVIDTMAHKIFKGGSRELFLNFFETEVLKNHLVNRSVFHLKPVAEKLGYVKPIGGKKGALK